MMLAQSLKLLGLFVNLCIFASATPIDSDIVTSSPAALERRLPVTAKNKCPSPSHWVRRECTPTVGPRAWRDVCNHRGTAPHLAPTSTYLTNLCPENNTCAPAGDANGDETIRCNPLDESKGGQGSPKRTKEKQDGTQYGTSELVTGHGGHNPQQQVDGWINLDVAGVSVSAMFISADHSFVVAPTNIIVGKIQGTETTVCKGNKSDPQHARQCYPTGKHNLRQGQVVNFTFGLAYGQSGYLNWAVIPSLARDLGSA